MSEQLVHNRILRKYGSDIEYEIKLIWTEKQCTEDYSRKIESITTRTMIAKKCHENSQEWRNTVRPISKESTKEMEKKLLKCNKCGRTSYLASSCTKRRLNEIQSTAKEEILEEEQKYFEYSSP
ncbi:hypothetical protein O181_061896 [Austropuccinia psidii MF-1]|uniref:Uncharacterized protein n=1 Tax=Austropuccinia psidii MF-1 TaxID=1389203 RepID=A0A9Q3EH07_9BASI|nr:hypothetical protein [Austropuccinia psidii MF-1]